MIPLGTGGNRTLRKGIFRNAVKEEGGTNQCFE